MTEKFPIVLLIEDDAVLRKSIADYLEDRLFEVLEAENGVQGIQIFEKNACDLVLTDLRMPELDGHEVLRRIGQNSPETPMIVISGTGRIKDSVRALRLGAWDYILKPIEDMSIISYSIKNALEKASLIRENRLHNENLALLIKERTKEIEYANLYLKNVNEKLHQVVRSTMGISACRESNGFASYVLKEFVKHNACDKAGFFLVEPKGLHLVDSLDRGSMPHFIPFPLSQGSILNQVLYKKKSILFNCELGQDVLLAKDWKGYGKGSYLIFPLLDEVLDVRGLLVFFKNHGVFDEHDKEIGAILASYSYQTFRVIKATETLQKSESRFRDLVQMLPEAIFESDLNMKITYVNKKASELFGYDQSDFKKGLWGENFLAERERKKAWQRAARRAKGEMLGAKEYFALKKDGTEFPILFHMSPIYEDQKAIGFRGIVIDLTESKQAEKAKKKLESQLRQAQKMEALGTLAGGIAHDFNNMLAVILGYSELGYMINEEESVSHSYFKEIHKAGERAKDMVTQILTFSRKLEPDLKPLDLNYVVLQTEKMLERTIPKMVSIELKLAQDLWPVDGDFTQLSQVIMNLATNANDAMPQGGKLSIKTENVKFNDKFLIQEKEFCSENYVRLSIADTGHGIDKQKLEHIFDPFFTDKEVGKGTGLGLATVYGIVKSHSGHITCESLLNEGTIFRVYLPCSSSSQEEDTDVEGGQEDSFQGNEGILLVDDEVNLRELGTQILSSQGYKVLTAETGEQALKVYKQKRIDIDLVLLDINMPGMGGYKCLKALLELNPNLKILILSGYAPNKQLRASIDSGAAGYIAKPFKMFDLLKTLRQVLDK